MICPMCSQEIEQNPGYTSWCDCGWNVNVQPSTKSEIKQYKIGQDVFSRHQHLSSVPYILGSFVPTILLVLIASVILGVIGVELILMKAIFASIIGVLILLGFVVLIKPLFFLPIRRKHLTKMGQFPALKDWLRSMNYPATHVYFTQRYGFRFHSVPFRRKRILEIGVPLARLLNQASFETALIREMEVDSLKKRTGWNYMNWARGVLFAVADLCIELGAERERWRAMQMGGFVRTPTVNQWAKILLVPFGFIPYGLFKLTDKSFLTVYHRIVYQANARTAEAVGNHNLMALLNSLGYEDAALHYGREFKDRLERTPKREKQRLVRTATEENFFRPMVDWQFSDAQSYPSSESNVGASIDWQSLQVQMLNSL